MLILYQDALSVPLHYSTPIRRHRKRHADEDLLARIQHYEDLLKKNNIDYDKPDKLDSFWGGKHGATDDAFCFCFYPK